MNTQVHVVIRCPQCGGDIDFLEENRVVRCEYCGISLLVSGRRGVLRFIIPPRHNRRKEMVRKAEGELRSGGIGKGRVVEAFLFYAPYWRMQASTYRWIFGRKPIKVSAWSGTPAPTERKKVLITRLLDHTVPGYRDVELGMPTLGVRSQVLRLRAFDREHLEMRARFLPLEVSFQEIHQEAMRRSELLLDPEGIAAEAVLHRNANQRYSVIYYPLWYLECEEGRTFIYDAVGGRRTGQLKEGASLLGKLMGEGSRKAFRFSEIRFLPFRCPNCGWDFPYRPLSVLHFCPSCHGLWREHQRRWSQVPHATVPPPSGERPEGLLWVPFWCFRAVLESGRSRLENMADLYKLAPPPRAVDAAQESGRPIFFYIPAARFRNPKVTHDLASRMTFRQPRLPSVAPFPPQSRPRTAGVSLSETDARELGIVVLGTMLPYNARTLEWLRGCRVRLMEARILYFPFRPLHLFWKELWTGVTFQKNALLESPSSD